MAKGKGKSKSKQGKKQYRKKGYKKASSVPDYASLSETYDLTNPATGTVNFTSNTMFQKRDFTLAGQPRAAAVGAAYQHYRIKKVTLKFKPQLDTFLQGGGNVIPNFHYMIDKSGSLPTNVTLAAMKSMGAKPLRFDDKTITVQWRPSVLTATASAPGVDSQTQYRISPWLSTNANALNPGAFVASSVDHLGLFWYLEQVQGNCNYNIEATIEYQFKKPLNATLAGETEAIKV